MEQGQFRVSFPLGTKLLFSAVALLLVVIFFLVLSSFLLLKDDKRAYTYQAQATVSLLAGQRFTSIANRAIDVLRLSLATIDPHGKVASREQGALQAVLGNQKELVAIRIKLVKLDTADSFSIVAVSNRQEMTALGAEITDLDVEQNWLKVSLPRLTKDAFAFFNVSRIGSTPMLAVAYADLNLKTNPKGMPVAIGFVSTESLARDLAGSGVTVADGKGWLLYDTDPARLFARGNISGEPLFKAAVSQRLAEGAGEFKDSGTRFLGSYLKPGLDLVVLSKTRWIDAMSGTFVLTERLVLLGLMAIGAAIAAAILYSRTLTAPLLKLSDAAQKVAKGEFDLYLRTTSKDEIGALSHSFNIMSSKIKDLIRESMEKVRIDGELAIARTVQQTLIPPSVFDHDRLAIRSSYDSASECGGDWWGFFGVRNHIAVMIADATGHGLPSALMTASARSCFSVLHKIAQEEPEFSFSPSAMLSFANRVVFDSASGRIMMTFFIGVFDLEEGTLTYASAGHNPPWLFQKQDGSFKMTSLVAKGQRLGEARDVDLHAEKQVKVNPGDILMLYTDGLLEGKNTNGEMYNKKRAIETIEANLSSGPEQVIDALVRDYKAHNQGKPLDDDITLACCMIRGEA